MSENLRAIGPLDWRALVAEAIRRRKAEKLTQKEHAALASVSIPTIVAFDRGERTLTLAKAFDILRVVGLLKEPTEDGAQEAFVRDAYARWRELSSELPKDSPGRFPDGWYRIDYALEGDLKHPELHRLQEVTKQATVKHTGWPMFVIMDRDEFKPREVDGVLECWLRPSDGGVERNLDDAAHCDFWRASPNGRMLLMRGYQEDTQETFPPQTVMDTTLPVWRMGEGLLHAAHMAKLMKSDAEGRITVRFRVLYTGLTGRVLRSWANPLTDLTIEGGAARSDEAMLETVVPADEIESKLAEHIYPLVASLYERFGVTGLAVSRVSSEIERFRSGKF